MDSTSDTRVITQDEVLQSFGTSINNGNAQINSTKTSRVSTGTLYCQGDAYIYGCIRTPLKLCNGISYPPGSAAQPAITFGDDDSGLYGEGSKVGISSNGTKVLMVGDGAVEVSAPITTSVGNLVLNPAGSSVDFSGKDATNVNNLSASYIASSQPIRAYDSTTVVNFWTVINQVDFVAKMQLLVSTIVPPQFQLRFNPGTYNISATSILSQRPITFVGDTRFVDEFQRPSVRNVTSTWTVGTASGNTTITFSGAYVPVWNAFGSGDTCWVVDDTGGDPINYPVVSTTSNSITFTGTPSINNDGCAIWLQPNVIFELSGELGVFQATLLFEGIFLRSTNPAVVRRITANNRLTFRRCCMRAVRVNIVINCDMSLLRGVSWGVSGVTDNELVAASNPVYIQQHLFVGNVNNECGGISVNSRGNVFAEAEATFVNFKTAINSIAGSINGGSFWIGSTAAPIVGTTGVLARSSQINFINGTYVNQDRALDLLQTQYSISNLETFTGNNVNIYDRTNAYGNLFTAGSAIVALTGGTPAEISAAGLNWTTSGLRTINNATNAHQLDLISGTWVAEYSISFVSTNAVGYTASLFVNGASLPRSSSQSTGTGTTVTLCSSTILTIVTDQQLSMALTASVNDSPNIVSVRIVARKLL